jgi:hypothetical protein
MSEAHPEDLVSLVERVRARCLEAAETAYEDAGIQGLCAEGRWEVAMGAVKGLDLGKLLRDSSGAPADRGSEES